MSIKCRSSIRPERELLARPKRFRTPDPQIRSLVLYPAELRARRARSYRLRPRDGKSRPFRPAGSGRMRLDINRARGRRDGRQARRRGREWSAAASRRWCPRPGGFRRHGRAPVRRRWRGPSRCRRCGSSPGTPRTDGRAPCSEKPGPVSDTSITTTAPSRRPVMRIWSRPGSRVGRGSPCACTALRDRLSRMRNS